MSTDWRKPALRAVLLLAVGLALLLVDNDLGWWWVAGLLLVLLAGDEAKDALVARRARGVTGQDPPSSNA